ncbi:LysR family transcriptional regulator [Undibacterium terreum]|uniref:LysR family transcriptional regulator n=1 Tax=Undibacterium terreum TaxID=1224302 RepID=A0A916XJB2_9BURK|nr:LysR family transcriptional regulator [Undibacterium terreum]GGC76252.1 LysR family transcriptional regulator [Undibacterium terreum]
MQMFTRIVELGSFTRAAESMQLPRATVTHTIKQLESHLGTRLLQRTTRQVSTTLDGEAYYHRCVRLLADLEETEAAFSHNTANPRGKLRVSLQASLGRNIVIPALPEFHARYPNIELEIGTADRLVDLVREGVDCVLRGGELRDSSMVGRRVASMLQITCASASYLDKYGEPKTLEDLKQHRAVNYVSSQTGRAMDFEFIVDGITHSLAMDGIVSVNDVGAYLASCEAGFGLIQAPRHGLAKLLDAGIVREVLSEWRPAPMPLSVLYPHHRQLSPRVRVFVEWISGLLGDLPDSVPL